MALDVVFVVLAKVGEYLVAPIGHQLGYVVNYKRNIKVLKEQVAKLEDERHRLQGSVDAAIRSGELIENDVEKWLSRTGSVVEKVGKLLDVEVQQKHTCLKGWCPDLGSRYRVGKKLKKSIQAVRGLSGNGRFDHVSQPVPPPENIFPSDAMYEPFDSRVSLMNDIIEALKEDNIGVVGIYGMAGVGKTILANRVGKQAKDLKLFDAVVIATVSQTPSLKDIQDEIADMLGFKFTVDSFLIKASCLCERILKEKRILIILDDVWSRLDLEKVGIPLGHEHGGCKIILTSRSLDTCIEMDTHKDFFVEVFPEWEALKLFKKMAGDSTNSPNIHPFAVEIAKECAGLPIAIVTVARALKNRSIVIWKDALQQLRKSVPTSIKGMHSIVFSSLELSYNYLESEEVKTFFLLCCLFPEDCNIAIQELLECGLGMGLFQNVDTLEEARVRSLTIVHNLKSSCLLLEGSSKDCVKMHDVVRDVALSIASKDKHVFLARAGEGLKRWPKNDVCEQCTAISLYSDDINELPDGLVCPKLQMLLVECSYPSLEISSTFFKGMENLRVLDLSHMHILSLPPSVCSLKKLCTLRLDHCKLNDISMIKVLKTLEILSFRGSNIRELPIEIIELTHLRLLDLTRCESLKVIPLYIIANLAELEELYMLGCFQEWKYVGHDSEKESGRASMVELKNLSHLTALDIHIPNIALLPRGFLFKSLVRFKISIGSGFDGKKEFLYSRTLKLENDMGVSLEGGIKFLFKKLEDLHLYKLKNLVDVLHDLNRDGFLELKYLEIGSCSDLKYLVNTEEWCPPAVFPVLECLKVSDADNMKEVCCGSLPNGSFSNLRKLWLAQLPALLTLWKGSDKVLNLHNLRIVRVKYCCRLENLFSPSIAKGLNQLQVLEISSCNTMKQIVGNARKREGIIDMITFPQLMFLKLQHLCELTSFWPEENSEDYLETLIPCPLFSNKVSFPSLKELQIKKLNNLKQIWHSQLLVESFCELKVLRISCCDELLNVFSHKSMQKLINLEELYVGECGSLIELFDLQGLIFEESHGLPLLFLKKIRLQNLPMLMHVWNRNPGRTLGIENLNSLEIHRCDRLKTLLTPSMAKGFVQLQFICIDSCEMMEGVISVENDEELDLMDEIVFPRVIHLKIAHLPNLRCFYLGSSTLIWPCLEELSLVDCPKMKTFVLSKTNDGKNGTFKECGLDEDPLQHSLFNDKVSFPNLKKLKSEGLQNLQIWHNQLQVESFCKLKVILVERSQKLMKLFPANFLQRLQHLEQLTVSRCHSLEELFEIHEHIANKGNGLLPQLKELRLWGLPKLMIRKIYEGLLQEGRLSMPRQFLFSGKIVACLRLEMLKIEDFHSLNEIWHGQPQVGAFSRVRYLAVRNCHKLQHIIPSILLKNLYNLRKLVVENCSSVEEILAVVKGQEAIDKLVFPQLTTLEFTSLPNLKCFCSSTIALEFPSLVRMQVEDCPRMQTFSSGALSTPMLQKVSFRQDSDLWVGDLNNTLCHLSKRGISGEKVSLKCLQAKEDMRPLT